MVEFFWEKGKPRGYHDGVTISSNAIVMGSQQRHDTVMIRFARRDGVMTGHDGVMTKLMIGSRCYHDAFMKKSKPYHEVSR